MQFQQYEKYKPSGIDWLGEIPEGWEVKRLKDVISIPLSYGANESALEDNPDYPRYIRITDFSDEKIRDDIFVSLAPSIANNYLLQENDILFARSGATVGKSFIFRNYEGKACYAGYLIKVRNKKKIVNSDFLYKFTKTYKYSDWTKHIQIKSTIENISAEKYGYFLHIPIPPLQTQTAIAKYLDQQTTLIDRKIELFKAKKQSYLELKQTLINEVVTGGLDKTAEMKDSEIEWIGQIPKHWELKRGKDLFKYIKKINKQLECKNVLSLTYNGVINKDYNTKAGLNPESYETYQFVDKNDLIFKLIDLENIKTSRVGIVHEHGIMSSAYIRLKSNKSFNKYFYYLYFYYYKINLFNYLGGGVRSTINFSTLLEISIIIPKKSEQIAIANYLDEKTNKIDQIIKKIDENVLALQEFRKTLINNVVTGKVKVL